jgi:glycosyltransferase involved in cell wall biosynthesis
MKVAIVHYWLVGMRGGEKVLEALCRMFPDADIFTHAYRPEAISDTIRRHRVFTTWISKLPAATRLYQIYLPLMPQALEDLDLSAYDLVISSESGPAKGVIVRPDAIHLCYCHSPMRYLWDQYHVYRQRAGPLERLLMPPLIHRLRQWDVTSAARVDAFVANSNHVAARIRKYWRRDSTVVHPPVAVRDFAPVPTPEVGDYYLWVGELVGYKRPDLAVDAFNRLRMPLVMIGRGRELGRIRNQAGPTIRVLGQVPFEVLKSHLARCRALVFPGEEDFGIVPVEAMASGRPVIAYARGGVLDSVVDGQTGILFQQPTSEALCDAITRFERSDLVDQATERCLSHAVGFTEDAFREGMLNAIKAA